MSAAGPVAHHAVHIGTLLGPALVLAAWAGWSDLRARSSRPGRAKTPAAVTAAAAMSIGAAAIHAVVAPAHFAEDPLYGGFFVACVLAQLSWAVLAVVRPHRLVLEAGAFGNTAIVGLWAITRAVGIPLGIAAGSVEPIGLLDTACGLLEVGVVICCLLVLRPRVAPVSRGRTPAGTPG